ncbi:MAG: electron transfer flavoprotein subunit beta/FixA family protein [Clostridiales bacterium]|nr:electron transfer flavoprotein subunit beta/FixA family protein [Clostridiales bacterium]
MNIVVCVKQTFDTEAKIVLDGSGNIDGSAVKLVINPYDEYAIEEALKLKEKFGGDVTLVSMGGERAPEALKTGFAMGADRGVLVTDPALEDPDEWACAEVLAKAISQIPYDIILTGRVAIDDGSGQVAVRMADALGVPSVSCIVELSVEDGKAVARREIDGGTELVEVCLPAVLTAQKGLNIPRLPSMAGIMKAKNKELKKLSLADVGIDASGFSRKMSVPKLSLPNPRKGGKTVPGEPAEAAKELARLLREEAKAI